MTIDPADSLDALIERARAAFISGSPEAPGPFTGEADEGRVRAQVALDGRLVSLSLDPDLQGRALPALGAAVVAAVNAALDARPVGAPDSAALLANLREVQEQSVVEMRRITQSLTAALTETVARVGSGTPGADGPGRPGPR